MKIQVQTNNVLRPYCDPTGWQNSTLRYAPKVDFPAFLANRLGKAKIMRTFITLDEYWDYRTDITYPDYEIGVMRYPIEQLHYRYDLGMTVPSPYGTRFEDYLVSHSRHAQELLLNVRRYEREVSDGIITYDQYEDVFYRAVEYCKSLAPNIRYVECCNEVDIAAFGLLNAEEYVKIYLRAHKAITKLNEKYNYEIPLELGGFAQAHPLQNWQLMLDIMKLLQESEIGADPMAFYSYHLYNAPENRNLTLSDRTELIKLSGVEKLKKITKNHWDMIEKMGLPKKPVFLNELGRARATGADEDSLYNAAGILTYLIAFCNGEYGEAYPFPWCTFHNPNLQISFTQYVDKGDGVYAATPNGIALEMLHSMHGQQVATTVSECFGRDVQESAIAVADGDEVFVLCVNTSPDSDPAYITIEGIENGTYQVDSYICDLWENNVVYKRGLGDGTLKVIKKRQAEVTDGVLTDRTTLDRNSFVLVKIKKI